MFLYKLRVKRRGPSGPLPAPACSSRAREQGPKAGGLTEALGCKPGTDNPRPALSSHSRGHMWGRAFSKGRLIRAPGCHRGSACSQMPC